MSTQLETRRLEVEIAPAIAADRDAKAIVDRAAPVLQQQLGHREEIEGARWSLGQDDEGRPSIDLELWDDEGDRVVRRLAPRDTKNEGRLSIWLLELYGDLRAKRTRKSIQLMHEAIARIQGPPDA